MFAVAACLGSSQRRAGSAAHVRRPACSTGSDTESPQPTGDSLETFMRQGAARSATARPARRPRADPRGATIRRSQRRCCRSKARAVRAKHRAVADAVPPPRCLRQAHEYLTAARQARRRRTRPPTTAWRASGAIGDSRISALAEPTAPCTSRRTSPAAHNTLGTVLQALGRRGSARAGTSGRLQLDPLPPTR